jgi:hypothetical protein
MIWPGRAWIIFYRDSVDVHRKEWRVCRGDIKLTIAENEGL